MEDDAEQLKVDNKVSDTITRLYNINGKNHSTGNPTRGAIKVEVSTSESIITSASEFSIFVVIRNPYNVPITIYTAQTHIPIELLDAIWEDKYKDFIQKLRFKKIEDVDSILNKTVIRVVFAYEDFIRYFNPMKGPRIAEAVSIDVKSLQKLEYPISSIMNIGKSLQIGKVSGQVAVGSFIEQWDLEFPTNPTNEELDRIFRKIEDYRADRIPILLQPGNALIKQFVLRARKSLFFTPIEYTFQIQTKYAVDDEEQYEVVPFKLDIHAAISSTIIGSIVGGIIGTIAQVLSKGKTIDYGEVGLAAMLAAIFSGVTVVSFARKANAQQIISIEDFWGGFFIGFLIGYLGEGFFRNLIGQ